ncbi:hypothetical protein EXIGLDRAFT_759499 [Exidia glandulosa HHB12029]|uniref:Mid2 domain-containing protein n=1 Tax=Exidia glandulosa HHB12029 TaxID=1314781 RepID=A0A165PX32_EXIGL|nr:hypothetical protein EXIGLDRAFT_759499 [Exidia glandulosa HHB12029]
MAVSLVAAGLALGVLGARGQSGSTTAVCTYADWTINSDGESACLVWAQLQSLCKTSGVSVGRVTNATAPYPPPSGSTATDCNCNVVAYNLMAGCVNPVSHPPAPFVPALTDADIYSWDWVPQAVWAQGCSSYTPDGLPSSIKSEAAALDIPQWAFLVPSGSAWSAGNAEDVAEGGSASATASGSSGPSRATTSASSTAWTDDGDGPYYSGGDDFDEGTVKNVGTILGAVLGVLIGLPALGSLIALIVFCNRENNRKKFYGPLAAYYQNGGAPPPELMTQAAPMGMGGPAPVPVPMPLYAQQPGYAVQQQQPTSPFVQPQPSYAPYAVDQRTSTYGSPSPAPPTITTSAGSSGSPLASPQQAYIQPGSPPVTQQQQQPWNPFHQLQAQEQQQQSAVSAPPPGAYVHGTPMV